jgi:hypothetical protein
MEEQVIEIATEVWQTSHWTNEQIKRLERFYSLVRNAALTEAIDKARIFGLGLPIAQTERLIKALESLKEPTP